MGRQPWKKVDISGDRWKTKDNVNIVIHTPIITVSLASKNRLKLLAILPLFPYGCRIFFYLNFTDHPSLYLLLLNHPSTPPEKFRS